MKLDELMAPDKPAPKPRTDKQVVMNRKIRARLIAQAYIRNGMQMLPAVREVVGPHVKDARRVLNGVYGEFIDELNVLMKNARIDKEQALSILWSIIHTSLLDYFDESGRFMSMAELKKLPRVMQLVIETVKVQTVEKAVMVKGKPALDEQGNIVRDRKTMVEVSLPPKLKAIEKLAEIMKWTSTTVTNNTNILQLMVSGEERARLLEGIYKQQ